MRPILLALALTLMISACGGDQPPPPPPAPPVANPNPGPGLDPNQTAIPPGGQQGYNPCGNGYEIEIYYDYQYCVPRRWRRW